MIEQYFDQVPYQVVKTNDTINTGKYDFVFVEMQMIHWPDNMLTYCPQLKNCILKRCLWTTHCKL